MKTKGIFILPLIIVVSVVAGIFIGNTIKHSRQAVMYPLHFSKSNKLTTIFQLIEDGYVDSVDIDKIIEDAIPDILQNLDPHTAYIPAKYMQEVEDEMRGNFSGIGVQFSIQEDTVRVIEVISGGPSGKVGILPGDRIVRVNDSIIAGVNVQNNTVLNLLRGEKNSKVEVGILRRGHKDLLEFEIVRDDIPLLSVDVSYMIDDETGFIKISRFSDQTYVEFMKGMQKLSALGAGKVIIDLRQNPGGSLGSVLQIVDEFLEKGESILYTEGLNSRRKTYTASGKNTWKYFKVFVLIDEFSASASEIFAGAIQDNDRGLIIGRRSFGKGLVQEQIPLIDGSALRLTVARFYTPSGRCIQKSYSNGNTDYNNDILYRIDHMEQLVPDSIHFTDSLKYYTKDGRVVYGGGGIMPDIFVPVDTTGNSEYFNQILRRGLIYAFAYNWTDSHREELSQLTTGVEIESYMDSRNVLEDFIQYAEERGIKKDNGGFQRSGEIIDTQIKAYVARNILGEEGFYPVIKQLDNTLLKAIETAGQNLIVRHVR
ncbi:MAG: S41 family peptidase [Prolixibacteraceae bacterium]|nr:S41 family peptidase [Prolixibacteraceae bacterium]